MTFRSSKLFAATFLLAAAGCSRPADVGSAVAAYDGPGPCPMGDEILTHEVLTSASIPSLSDLDRQQIIAAVHESVHDDVVTIEEAFAAVDEGLINRIVLRDSYSNQFYVEIEYGAGDNSYGAYLYWGTAVVAAAIHDGFPEECGPAVFDYDQGDVAPECHGFLDYANTATYAELDAYLPSNVAQAIVTARTSQPFTSVASVVAVSGVAEARLQQILTASRTAGFVGASCSGIYDQVAVSTGEAGAIVDLVDQASREEIQGVLSFLVNQTVVDTLVATRPYASVGAVSDTDRVGTATFRALRDAATYYRPFEQLVGAVNLIDHPDGQIRLDQHFDWRALLPATGDETVSSIECFGIDPALLPEGATNRPNLADGDEVTGAVSDAVSTANLFGELSVDPTPGLTDLGARTAGHTFLGCYVSYHPNPWQYDTSTFFVDAQNGASLLVNQHDVE